MPRGVGLIEYVGRFVFITTTFVCNGAITQLEMVDIMVWLAITSHSIKLCDAMLWLHSSA